MSDTVGDYLLERLSTWGIRRIYGYPGDGINGIMGAFTRSRNGHGQRPEFVQVRHEEMAAFMACAHAKFTGEVGVCMATSGPGAVHLLNGLYDAKLDHQPVVAIVGQQARAGIGGNYQQEIDLVSLFKDVAHEYVEMAMAPAQIRHLVDRAIRIALSERTVTAIVIPNDVQEADPVPTPPHKHGTVHSGPGYSPPRIIPTDADLDRAAEVLNAGQRVAMLVGAGALHASDEVAAVAETLGAGVAKALLGKAVLPDDLPYVTGSIGLLGTKPSWAMMQECDTLLMVGSSFPYSEFLPEEGKARGVQIDHDGKMIGIRYPMEVNLIGDSNETLRALIPRLQRKDDRSWREKIEGEVREWWNLIDHRAELEANPVNPQLVFRELSGRLPDGAIIGSDSGSSANWYARDIKLRKGMMASLSGRRGPVEPLLGLLAVDCGPRQVALGQPGRELVAEDRVHGREADVQLAAPVARGGMGSPINRAGRDLGLVDRRHRHRVARHLAQAVIELGRVHPGQLDHRHVDARAAVAQLAAQRLEHALHRVLGAAVRRLQRDAAVGQRGADLDDRAAVPRHHARERRLGAPHRPEIGDAGGALELVRIDVVEEREHRRHRVVDPHVDRPEALFDRARGRVDRVGVRDVGLIRERDAAEVRHVPRRRVEARASPRDQPHRRAVLGELPSDRAPDPPGGPGDDDYLAFSHFTTSLKSVTNCFIARSRSSSGVRRIADGCVVNVTSSARSDSNRVPRSRPIRICEPSSACPATAPRHTSARGRTTSISASSQGRHAFTCQRSGV